MGTLVQQLLNAASRGPSDLNRWLGEHASELTLELAAEARKIFKQALDSREGPLAAAAALGAAFVFLRLGKRYEALTNYLDYYQILFMRADDVEAYQMVREGCRQILSRAEEIEANDLAFQAATLAADRAFFGSESEGYPAKQQPWLLMALEDLVSASDKAKHYTDPVWFEKFLSLLSATVSEVTSRVWVDKEEAKVQERLRQLAAATEALVPVEFEFPGDALKTNGVARTFADLSYRYGTPAVANARLSVAIQRAEDAGDVGIWMQTVFARYVGARDPGSPHSQLTELRRSLRRQVEQFRLKFRSRAGRLWAAQELDRIFGELLRDEFKQKGAQTSELFEAVEAVKTRTLLDQMGAGARDFPTAELAAQAAKMERQMLHFEPEDTRDLISSEIKLASLLSIGTYWDRTERRQMLGSIEDFYAAHQAGFQEVEPITHLSQVMSALQPDEALIEYCIPHRPLHPAIELWIVAVTSQKAQVIPMSIEGLPGAGMIGRMSIDGRQPMDISPLGQLVVDLRMAIQKADEAKAQIGLEALYQLLISPLLELGLRPQDFHRWIMVPYGMLHYIPFAALSDAQGRHLIEDVALTVAPSGSVWFKLQERQTQPVTSFLGFANPVLSYSNLPQLVGAEEELERVRKSLKGLQCTVYKHKKATEAALRAQIANKSIVHLATHGEFPEEDAIDFHRILLSPTAEHDGRVHAEELHRMDLHLARLVVLSICNGGLYRFGPGDEPYGLISALLAAGVENVLGTLWPLEDQIGRLFMVEFYKYLLQCGPAEALRRACKQFIQDQALLRHWAGFVLVGPGRPLK